MKSYKIENNCLSSQLHNKINHKENIIEIKYYVYKSKNNYSAIIYNLSSSKRKEKKLYIK